MYFLSSRSFLVVIVSYLFVRTAQCKETEVASPIRRPPEMGKRSDNSPAAVNKEYKFIVLVEATSTNGTHTWLEKCVGTIVTENQVITAGHCVQPRLKNNAEISEVNIFVLRYFKVKKVYCMKTPVRAFINYKLLSRDGEPNFDLGLLYLSNTFKLLGTRTLPLCNDSESEQASEGPLFSLSFDTDEQETNNLLLTRVPLRNGKNVKSNDKWLSLKLRRNGVACSGDSGSPVVLQTRAGHFCLLAVVAKIRSYWEDDGIQKSDRIEAPIVKYNGFITKMIKEGREPNSVEKQEWPRLHGLHFRELLPSLKEGGQQSAPVLPEVYLHPKKAGCFNALWHFCKPGK